MIWTKEIFNYDKPIIAMCHLLPLPDDPLFDEVAGIHNIIETAIQDINILQSEGVHGLLISNEFSYPYTKKISQVTVATMARIIGELKKYIKIPFGVDCMYDAFSTIDLAIATDADFYRITLPPSTVFEYEFGITQLGNVLRYAMRNGLKKAKKVVNIDTSVNIAISSNNLESLIRAIVVQAQPDALCISTKTINKLHPSEWNITFKDLKSIPLICDGGCNEQNITSVAGFVNGIIIGTALKENQEITNPISQTNVRQFLQKMNSLNNI